MSLMLQRSHVPLVHAPKAKKPKSRLTRGGAIKPVSAKRAKLNKVYSALREAFLRDHPFCQHWMAECGLDEKEVIRNNGWYFPKETDGVKTCFLSYRQMAQVPRSSEIHHQKGRDRFLLDTSLWMAVRACHSVYLHTDPKRYEKGYCLPR